MLALEKFINELQTMKIWSNYDENIVLTEEYNAIIQMKLPLKLKDPGHFIIHCSIGKLNVGQHFAT